MGSPMALLNLTLSDLERSKSRSLRFSVVGHMYEIDISASNNITTLTWMSQRELVGRWGFPLSQRPFSLLWHLALWECLYKYFYSAAAMYANAVIDFITLLCSWKCLLILAKARQLYITNPTKQMAVRKDVTPSNRYTKSLPGVWVTAVVGVTSEKKKKKKNNVVK